MDRFEKQPYEEFTIDSDFSENMTPGETIVWQAVLAEDWDGVDATAVVTDQSTVTNDGASKVSVWVRAGTEEDAPYKITFRCITSVGHKWEHDVEMRVREN